jgi:hypothetical protein
MLWLLTSSSSYFPLLSFLQSRVIESNSYAICDQSKQSSFLLFYMGCSFFWLFVLLLYFSHDQSNCSSPSFSSTTFHNSQGISDLRPGSAQVSAPYKLCSKCSFSWFSSLELSQICYGNASSSCWMSLLPWQSWIWFRLCILHHPDDWKEFK